MITTSDYWCTLWRLGTVKVELSPNSDRSGRQLTPAGVTFSQGPGPWLVQPGTQVESLG